MSATIRQARVTFTVPDGVDDDMVAALVRNFLAVCIRHLVEAHPTLFAIEPAVDA